MKITEEMVDAAETAYDLEATAVDNETCWRSHIRAALEAALASIPDPEPLSDEVEAALEEILTPHRAYNLESTAVAKELRRRCPKPAPKQRTPRELADDAVYHRPGWTQSLAELVALAEKNK